MAVTITTLVFVIIIGVCADIVRTTFLKIRVRPEFDSKAVDILAHRRFVKCDPNLSAKEKCIEFIVLDDKAARLLDDILQDDHNSKISKLP